MNLRDDLPRPIPAPIARLPRNRGYPVPWFVAWLDDAGNPRPRGQGTPDFRVLFPNAVATAVAQGTCWICGTPHSGKAVAYAFVIGPMCAVNRVSAEPPAHVACADWAARACPFLARPHMVRRENAMPEHEEAPGFALRRNPGVSLVWLTRTASAFPAHVGGEGMLFNVGDPVQVRFYREGRPATRVEIMESIETGLPSLMEIAEAEGSEAMAELERQHEAALELLPA